MLSYQFSYEIETRIIKKLIILIGIASIVVISIDFHGERSLTLARIWGNDDSSQRNVLVRLFRGAEGAI